MPSDPSVAARPSPALISLPPISDLLESLRYDRPPPNEIGASHPPTTDANPRARPPSHQRPVTASDSDRPWRDPPSSSYSHQPAPSSPPFAPRSLPSISSLAGGPSYAHSFPHSNIRTVPVPSGLPSGLPAPAAWQPPSPPARPASYTPSALQRRRGDSLSNHPYATSLYRSPGIKASDPRYWEPPFQPDNDRTPTLEHPGGGAAHPWAHGYAWDFANGTETRSSSRSPPKHSLSNRENEGFAFRPPHPYPPHPSSVELRPRAASISSRSSSNSRGSSPRPFTSSGDESSSSRTTASSISESAASRSVPRRAPPDISSLSIAGDRWRAPSGVPISSSYPPPSTGMPWGPSIHPPTRSFEPQAMAAVMVDDDATESGRYACPHCAKRFARPSSLRIHVHSHTGEKPFECYICNRCFSVQSNLRRHLKIHRGSTASLTEESEPASANTDGSQQGDDSASATSPSATSASGDEDAADMDLS